MVEITLIMALKDALKDVINFVFVLGVLGSIAYLGCWICKQIIITLCKKEKK